MPGVTTAGHKPEAQGQTRTLQPRELELTSLIVRLLRGYRVHTGVLFDRVQIEVKPEDLVSVSRILKDDNATRFKTLLCMAAVDYKDKVQMVYTLLSMEKEYTLVVKVDLPAENPEVPSLTGLWRAADWYEREAHDLFGVNFMGHPDLKPLLLYEGFEGHPGLKSFPFHEYTEY
jgi:NADH/F420H2 dehydrogenase subunit C